MIFIDEKDNNKIDINSNYQIRGFFDKIIDEAQLEEISKKMNIKDAKRVLEVNCGEGNASLYFAKKYPKTSFIAVESDINKVKEARNNLYKSDIRNLSYLFNKNEIIPYVNDYFDKVIFRDSFNHLNDPINMLLQAKKTLKNEKEIFISSAIPDLSDKNRFIDDFIRLSDSEHVKLYSKEDYIEMLGKLNFILKEWYFTDCKFSTNKINQFFNLLKKHKENTIKYYEIDRLKERIIVNCRVINMIFINKK